MMRSFGILAVMLALSLAGCAAGNGATPTPTEDAGAAMTCDQAFAQIDAEDAAEAIEEAGDALDATIEACDSAEEVGRGSKRGPGHH